MRPNHYLALLIENDGSEAITVVFPDLPGCISEGDGIDAALDMAADALAGYIDLLVAADDPVPPARSLSALKSARDPWIDDLLASGATPHWVPVLPTGYESERLTISLDRPLLETIDRIAAAQNMTRSEFIATASRRMLAGLGRLGETRGEMERKATS